MAARSAARLIPGLLFAWLIAYGYPSLPAADAQPTDAAVPSEDLRALESIAAPEPIAETQSELLQPSSSDCLGLLESTGETTYYDDTSGAYDQSVPCEATYCDPCSRYWLRADYLHWWTSGSRLPPLVTTSPSDAVPGVWGESTTRALFGNERVNTSGRSNFRVTMGYWVGCWQDLAMEGDYFDLGGQSTGFYRMSHGDPVLTRPYFDVQQGVQAVELIAYPAGIVSELGAVGDVTARASDFFASVGARMRYNLCAWEVCLPGSEYPCEDCAACEVQDCGGAPACGACNNRSVRLDLIAGYRYYRLGDSVDIRENLVATVDGPVVPAGTMFTVTDSFRATNEFNGGELGLLAGVNRGRWSFELLAKMALGNNRRCVTINGATAITRPGFATENYAGGLLALPTNIGRHYRNDFVVIPQFGAEIGYQITERLRAYVGYDFLLWANVVRTGDQIDLGVDPRNLPPSQPGGQSRPYFLLDGSTYWAQGINVGFELSF